MIDYISEAHSTHSHTQATLEEEIENLREENEYLVQRARSMGQDVDYFRETLHAAESELEILSEQKDENVSSVQLLKQQLTTMQEQL